MRKKDGRSIPIKKMYGTAWKNARERAAGVSFEDRQDLLGHKSRRITTHYSEAELANLIAAAVQPSIQLRDVREARTAPRLDERPIARWRRNAVSPNNVSHGLRQGQPRMCTSFDERVA